MGWDQVNVHWQQLMFLQQERLIQNIGKPGILLAVAFFPGLSINYRCIIPLVIQGQSPYWSSSVWNQALVQESLTRLFLHWPISLNKLNIREPSAFSNEGSTTNLVKDTFRLNIPMPPAAHESPYVQGKESNFLFGISETEGSWLVQAVTGSSP